MAVASRREKEKREQRKKDARSWADDQKQGWTPTAVKLPEGVEFWKPEEGENYIDVIPYKVEKGSDEKGGNPRCDSGYEHFERTFEVHRIPGTGKFGNPYACLRSLGEK